MTVNFPGSIDTTSTLLSPFNKYKWTSRLKTSIAEGETILILTDLSNIPSDVANNYVGIDDEIMFVISVDNSGSDKKITVTRGQGNSVAAPHSSGSEVLQVYTAEYHKKLVEAIIAIEEYTKSGDMSLDNLTQITTRNHNDLQNTDASSAHPASSITNVPAGDIAAVTVQAALNELDSEKVSKAGSLTQITTRNHADLQTPNADANYQHLTTAEVANITLKSGSLTQITTRNHNDLQNLNAGSAHPSASINNTSTSYGRGLATTDTTVQKIADRVNQNGTPAFKTSKDKCPLMLNFKDGLADSTNGITPIGYNTATKNKADNFISNPDGSISATLKQFEGDEGKFGSGIAVEESRTNLLLYSDDLTNDAWIKANCTVTLDRILSDGRKLFKVTAIANGDLSFYSLVTPTVATPHTFSAFFINTTNKRLLLSGSEGVYVDYIASSNLTRISGTKTPAVEPNYKSVVMSSATAGDTFYITSPQFEAGSFPTSYIATGATAVTRPAGKLNFDPKLVNDSQNISFSLWVKPNFNYTDINYKYFLGVLDTVNNKSYQIGYEYSVDKMYALLGSKLILSPVYTSNNQLQQWQHFVLKRDGSNGYFYINGQLIGTATNVETFLPNYFFVGCGNDNALISNSAISNFAIFNYALTADEIANIYNAGLENKPVELDNGKTVSEADRLSPNIEAGSNKAQFVTDKTKCSLLLDFKGTLADRSRAINPIGSDAANKWVDNFVNDSTTKTNATNISCTLKQFDGDEGKFGSGVAVEESRTNLFTYSNDFTNAAWVKTGLDVTLDRTLLDGTKIYKLVATMSGNVWVAQNQNEGSGKYTVSAYVINNSGKTFEFNSGVAPVGDFTQPITKLTRIHATHNGANRGIGFYLGLLNATPGDTFYLANAQNEAGAFPTSYIATGASAVTRPAGKLIFDNANGKLFKALNTTVSTWFKISDYTATKLYYIFDSVTTGDDARYYTSWIDVSQNKLKIEFKADNGTVISAYADITGIAITKYHHLAIKNNGSNIYIYLDGVLKTTSASISGHSYTPNATAIVGIGTNSWNFGANARLNGTISNFAIFNYALSADEISQIYNSGLEGKPIAITNPENIIPVGQSLHDPNFITFTSGWGISSTYPNKPTLSKSSNVALMRGILEYSGTVNSDVTIFTLPVGHRPSLHDTYYHSFVATARDSGAPAMRILRVYGNGDVKLMAQGATIVNPAISLDNINFVNGK